MVPVDDMVLMASGQRIHQQQREVSAKLQHAKNQTIKACLEDIFQIAASGTPSNVIISIGSYDFGHGEKTVKQQQWPTR